MGESDIKTEGEVDSAPSQEGSPTAKTTSNGSGDGPSELEVKIIKQVEYYFGDINMLRDKFLREEFKHDDGWVTLETMLKFNRLANLSKDPSVVVEALGKSKTGLMQISEDKLKIRRSPDIPLPEINENSRQELATRTVYCKGFPKDCVLDTLIEYFNQFDQVINVVMRNYNDKATDSWHFKGSVFINFKTVEGASAFLKLESVKYNDVELIRMWMKDYVDSKRKERMEERAKRPKNKNSKANKEEPNETEELEQDDGFPRGTVIQLSGFQVEKPIKREDVKETIEGMGISVAYIDYGMGDETAWVRLVEKDSAKELAKKIEEEGGRLEVNENNKLTVRVVDNEEEEVFLKKAKEDQVKRRQSNKNKGRSFSRRGRGRPKEQNRKRKSSPNSGPPAKIPA